MMNTATTPATVTKVYTSVAFCEGCGSVLTAETASAERRNACAACVRLVVHGQGTTDFAAAAAVATAMAARLGRSVFLSETNAAWFLRTVRPADYGQPIVEVTAAGPVAQRQNATVGAGIWTGD
jgi:hypothetical protein